jgi:hypothetical protein
MSLRAHINKRLIDLLQERRVVVWYDGEQAFAELAASFAAAGCVVVSAAESRLRARRRADEVLARMNDTLQPAQQKNANLLIYVPWARRAPDEERCQDPFEGFASLGTAFGDKESERFQSLARQAMPARISEIDRLFQEGRPSLATIESLGEAVRYPLLSEALGIDSVIEVAATLLCREGAAAKVNAVAGAAGELQRLLRAELGFVPAAGATAIQSLVEHLGRYVLFSEFAFDLPCPLPDSLANVPRAEEKFRPAIYALGERMRGSDDTREGYIRLAQNAEQALHLPELTRDLPNLGVRDTFPFEERVFLARLQTLAETGKLAGAREVVGLRRQSVWRYHIPERGVLWKLAERCVDLLLAVESSANRLPASDASVRDWVQAMSQADGFWQMDHRQRLVEQGAAECAENQEVEPLIRLCRERHREQALRVQAGFLRAVEREGWPPEGVFRQTQVFDRNVAPALEERRKAAYFLVDSMRYEMGRDLASALEGLGPVTVTAAVTVLPTTTPCGMAALMPGADGAFALVEDGEELSPAVGGRVLRNSADRMTLLRERYGDRFRDLSLGDVLSKSQARLKGAIGNADLLVVRTQEIDALGEGPSLYHARKFMSDVIGELWMATDRLRALGFETFVYAADHGHVLLPEVPPGDVLQQPPGQWKKTKRRSLLGHSTAAAVGVIVFPAARLGIVAPVPEFAATSGFKVFNAGEGYFHEGLSLQECVIPVVVLQARERGATGAGGEEIEIRYRADRYTSRVIGIKVWFNSLLAEQLVVRVAAYDGSGSKAKQVGDAADCDARNPATGLVTLEKGKETQVPVRIADDFDGPSVEIRATDPATGTVFHRLKLKNAVME